MLRPVARVLVVLTVCCAIGLHWIALQSVAWTAMFIANSQQVSLGKAFEKTLSGAHPCSLCHLVAKGKNAEKKSDSQSTSVKLDMLCPPRASALLRPLVPVDYALIAFSISLRNHSPPAPPPRATLS